MTDAASIDFAAQRNEDFGPFEARYQDADGFPTDLTGWNFQLEIAATLGGSPVLTIRSTPNPRGSYVATVEAAIGAMGLYIAKEDIAGLPGDIERPSKFFYNLFSLEPDGTRRVFTRGLFIAESPIGAFDGDHGLIILEDGFFLGTETGDILRY